MNEQRRLADHAVYGGHLILHLLHLVLNAKQKGETSLLHSESSCGLLQGVLSEQHWLTNHCRYSDDGFERDFASTGIRMLAGTAHGTILT